MSRAKIRAFIAEDEPLARRDLARLLAAQDAIELVGECGSGAEAVSAIRTLAPDLVFLDVQMPEGDGFDVLERLAAAVPPAVVFVTAFDSYAVRAFETGALDYLLKPFDAARFERMLARVLERLRPLHGAPAPSRQLAIRDGGAVTFVRTSDIAWVEAAGYYACVHAAGATHILRRTLAELEQELAPAGFARIHRSVIVNLARVRRLAPNASGDYALELDDGTPLKVGRRHRREIAERLGALPGGAGDGNR